MDSPNRYSKQDVMLRKEKAGQKAASVAKRFDFVKYEILEGENDIVLLSGPYINRRVSELWNIGPSERDYIVEKLWSVGDDKVSKVLNGMACV